MACILVLVLMTLTSKTFERRGLLYSVGLLACLQGQFPGWSGGGHRIQPHRCDQGWYLARFLLLSTHNLTLSSITAEQPAATDKLGGPSVRGHWYVDGASRVFKLRVYSGKFLRDEVKHIMGGGGGESKR